MIAALALAAMLSTGGNSTMGSVLENAKMGQAVASAPEGAEQRDKRMEWWREARLGMFIHWGLYAIPAGKWGDNNSHGEWIRETARIPVKEYEKLLPQFNPVKFDADSWVRMAKDAGMKYIVITTKHHDGFALFDSKHTDWDVMSSPFKRDIMKELAEACRRHGLKMCWYHSIMDWHHPDYLPRRGWEAKDRPANGANMDRYVAYLRNQVTELLTNYGDIAVMWFDGEWESTWNDGYGKPLYDLCRSLQPDVIVNNRVSNSRGGSMESAGDDQRVGDFSTPEQFIPPTGMPGVDWETCMTMNDHWGYNAYNSRWKSSDELIRNIVDIASKGGNYLLNIGPRADGTFPPEAVERLKDIGDWMDVNGEAIYGTQASLFESLPWGRSTTKGSTLYLHVFEWPKDGRLVVPGIGNDAVRAELLDRKAETPVRREGADLVVMLPGSVKDRFVTTVKLELKGHPIVYRTPKITAPTYILVTSVPVQIEGGSEGLQVRYTLDGSNPSASSPIYTGPFSVDATRTVKAAAFHRGRQVSSVSSAMFTKVSPKAAAQVSNLSSGIVCETYKGEWDRLPDFDLLTKLSSTVQEGISIGSEEFIGKRFMGYVRVPEDGVYVFNLTSDDGSKLWVGGEVLIDNDGLHGSETKSATIALAKGYHPVVLGWFNKTGGAVLNLTIAKVGNKAGAPVLEHRR